MKMKRLLEAVCFLVLCSSGSLSLANDRSPKLGSNIHQIGKSKLLIAKEAFQEYLYNGQQSTGSLSSKVEKVSGISVAEMILDLIEPLINQPESIQFRIKSLIEILKKHLSRNHLTAVDKEILRERLTPFLKRYELAGSRSNQLIESIYSRNDLWTAEELWYILSHVKNSAYVLQYFNAVSTLAKQLDPDGRIELAEALAKSRPYTLAPMLLFSEIREVSISQLPQMLQAIFYEFRPAPEGADVETFRPSHSIALRNASLRTLEELQIRYNQKEAAIVDVINARIQKASSSEARAFFMIFGEGGFLNIRALNPRASDIFHTDPLDIRSKILKMNSFAASPLLLVKTREGNVLAVNFQSRDRCLQLFTFH